MTLRFSDSRLFASVLVVLCGSGCVVYRTSSIGWSVPYNSVPFDSGFLDGLACEMWHLTSAYFLTESLTAADEFDLRLTQSEAPLRFNLVNYILTSDTTTSDGTFTLWIDFNRSESHDLAARLACYREYLRDAFEKAIAESDRELYWERDCDPFEFSIVLQQPNGATTRIEFETSECAEFDEMASEVCVNITGIYR